MALTAGEQKLFDAAKAALPRWFFADDNSAQEILGAFAKEFGAAWTQVDAWIDQTFITRAFGQWLDQLAKDRGTRRQAGENDASLAARLRVVEDQVTHSALVNIGNAVLAARGMSGSVALVELRRDHAYFQVDAGTGFRMAYMGRGYRMANPKSERIIVILPFGSDAALTAVEEEIHAKKAGGIIEGYEVREVP